MSQQGQRVYNGRYELHNKIARGGMADVFLARDALLDRPVALKVLFPEFATDPSFVERFRREAQAAANLNHPNIVSVYDWGEEGPTYFIVMEYVEGRSLAQLLHDNGRLHPDRAADITADIAAALGFAHRNGVIHRDVKPGNVLLTGSGQVKVADFGIARAVSAAENLTQTGTVMGTATYFSPEQARGESVDPRSDVYSLGVVLYEMLAGSPPFRGDSPVAVAYKHVQEQAEPLRQRNPDVPVALEAVVDKAMAKQPQGRYASADDFRDDLERFRSGRPVTAATAAVVPGQDATRTVAAASYADPATRAVPPVESTRTVRNVESTYFPDLEDREPPRRTWWFALILVLLLAALAGLLFLFGRNLDLGGDETPQVEVPSVLSLTEEVATQRLTDAGFEVETERQANDTVSEGTVFGQDPVGGVREDEGSTVMITVSSGRQPVPVPNVVGQTREDAEAAITGAGLTVRVEEMPSETEAVGIVLAQEPDGGEELPLLSEVRLSVSNGPAQREVPNVVGQTSEEAANNLGQAGFTAQFREQFSDQPEGTVLSTDPVAGTVRPRDSAVVVVVSSGPVPTTTTTEPPTTTTTEPPTTTTTTTTAGDD